MGRVKVAATQMSCGWNLADNIAKADKLVREAVRQGAQIVLLQELFETPYFCQKEKPEFFQYATELEQNIAVSHFRAVAAELDIVLPVSFFERKNKAKYNSLALIDAGGEILGVYRKTHIPDGPGYEEKYYFNPGDTGFQVWRTKYGAIGAGICWDQWYPETARSLAVLGAELIFYPTAIGSEPQNPGFDSRDHWQRCMQGHAAANLVPVIASNRIGVETIDDSSITFYGSSFITDHTGRKLQEAGRSEETVLVQEFDLDAMDKARSCWGIFRDRRPEMYQALLTYDGITGGRP
ncbi:N-carbamoylputrescine amidase|uniref:N-carbamoylputrescine amidase n=1 Tax=Dendrosporobacter quercicolus TaxID=146817 RepID=A0A1G9RJK1_9FIRM|nr:N-carbamoylputrescine amidase [Dendrosporobacter quercicolus]NSL49433.1 N-carbamoylputrescine amidase [Dendrosporobacter quercicolus DSM 1736]SDM23240.1 N-carbamoylputrescine amidase [Dendrosporobacter quercicolus]